MKLSKLIAVLLTLLLMASLFSACGGEGENETQPQATLPGISEPGGTQRPAADTKGEDESSTPADTAKDPAAATKGGASDEQPGKDPGESTGESKPDKDQTNPSQPNPGQSDPDPSESAASEPASSGVPSDDSGEDIPVNTTEAPDLTPEDLH